MNLFYFIGMSLNVLFLGEIVGRAGIACLKKGLKDLKRKHDVDICIANGEGTTNGFGLGFPHSVQLSKLGIDVITGGEKLYYKPDLVENIAKCSYIIRPANYPPQSPGRSYKILNVKDRKVAVVSFLSSSGFSRSSANNPFTQAEFLIAKLREENDIVLVQFHCATTAEAATFAHFLDGKAAAVIGTHNKVLTADAVVLENGTAFISDNGRCGSALSVGGLDETTEIEKFLKALPLRSRESWKEGQIQGVLVCVNEETGLAESITPVMERIKIEKPEEKND